jgi:hypothetical protein
MLFTQNFAAQITDVGYTTVNPTLEITAEDCRFIMSTDFLSSYFIHTAFDSMGRWLHCFSSVARAVAVWPGIVYAGVKGMFWLMIHLLPLVIHQS